MSLLQKSWMALATGAVACFLLAETSAGAELFRVEGASKLPTATFAVHHALTVKDIPEGAKKVRVWFWMPDDDDAQKVLDINVQSCSGKFQMTRDKVYGHRYLYAECTSPKSGKVEIVSNFTVSRRAVHVDLDPEKAGKLTAGQQLLLAEYLRRDEPLMEVDDRIAKLAAEICGDETNIVRQARKLFDWVVSNTDHYSKSPDKIKSSGKGSAEYCLNKKGGGCTDQHALFIALARARGIATRLHFGSLLKPVNEGKDHDPGYRCWVQYFVPGYGWVPMDISAANTNPMQKDFFFSGLDERRIRFLEGRNLELNPKQESGPVNLLVIAYVEVDGKPHTAFQRVVRFDVVRKGNGPISPR